MAHIWDLWFPAAGATGMSFCRSRIEAAAAGELVLVHAAPPVLDVTVVDESGVVVARGAGLERREPGPMSFLHRDGEVITLEDRWPGGDDTGRVVLLPGGEAGILRQWWHAEDHSEWRWQVEFYNHR